MSLSSAFGYEGKRVIVVGAATGMGRATAELALDLGAEVTAMDYADFDLPGAKTQHVNLGDKASVEAALATLNGQYDALFSAAGVADGTPNLGQINFVGHRHMINYMRAHGLFAPKSAIGMISSAAGMGWEQALESILPIFEISDWDESVAWLQSTSKDNYMATKQVICAYVAREALALLKEGIRINAICPGPTDTPLAQANKDLWLGFAADYRAAAGNIPASTPLDQAYPLVFLCSDAARAITGTTTVSDVGYFSAGLSESFPDATMIARALTGKLTF